MNAGFVVLWDSPDRPTNVPWFPTVVEAVEAIRQAERTTRGNISGTVHAVDAYEVRGEEG